jgi:hypothetical protein
VLSDQTASPFTRPVQRSYRWRFSFSPNVISAMGTALRAFVRAPALPNPDDIASIALPGVLHQPKTFDPDPFGTESPFTTDSWPR